MKKAKTCHCPHCSHLIKYCPTHPNADGTAGQMRPVSDFTKDKSRWDGLSFQCKHCRKRARSEKKNAETSES